MGREEGKWGIVWQKDGDEREGNMKGEETRLWKQKQKAGRGRGGTGSRSVSVFVLPRSLCATELRCDTGT